MVEKFIALEKAIMEKLLYGKEKTLSILRLQYKNSTVLKRDFTGTGFFTYFDIKKNFILESSKNFQIGDVVGQLDGLNYGVGFVLFIKKGVLDFLEGYTYGNEKWWDVIGNYSLSNIFGEKRDLEKLRVNWKY